MFNIFAVLLIFFEFSNNIFATNYVCELIETPAGFYSKHCRTGYMPNEIATSYPSKAILEEVISPKNQGRIGACVSFAVGGILEYLYKDINLKVSEAEFTVLAQTHLPEGSCRSDLGLCLGNALRLATDMGYIEEKRLPYNNYLSYIARENKTSIDDIPDTASICRLDTRSELKNYNNTMAAIPALLHLTGDLRQDSASYCIGGFFVIRSRADKIDNNNIFAAIKSSLVKGKPIAAAVSVFLGQDWDKTGIIKMHKSEVPTGSHAIALWGYNDKKKLFNDSKGTFIFRNSWGTNWGAKGYGYMPYEYVYNYATEIVAVETPM